MKRIRLWAREPGSPRSSLVVLRRAGYGSLGTPSRRRVGPIFLGLVWWLAAPGLADSQEASIAVGDRIRGAVPCPANRGTPNDTCLIEGKVLQVAPDTLIVRSSSLGAAPRHLTPVRLDVFETKGPGVVWTAGVGGALGAGGTYLWLRSGGSTSYCDRSRNQDAMSRGECAALTFLGGVVGAGLGTLTARLLRTEDWVPAPLGRLTLTINPALR